MLGVRQMQFRVVPRPPASFIRAEFSGVGIHVPQMQLHQILIVISPPTSKVRISLVSVGKSNQPSHLAIHAAIRVGVLPIIGRHLFPCTPCGNPFQIPPRHRFRGMQHNGPMSIVLVDNASARRILLGRWVQIFQLEEAIAAFYLVGGRKVELSHGDLGAELFVRTVPTSMFAMVRGVMRRSLGIVPRKNIVGRRGRQSILRFLLIHPLLLLFVLLLFIVSVLLPLLP
mmetsp:Transcript_27762/g.58660  ORF Transcript_27762/g.58660 Transcript_27762/m.58660 type:complete len:228 (-) Transcript_27762:821-1504(-)